MAIGGASTCGLPAFVYTLFGLILPRLGERFHNSRPRTRGRNYNLYLWFYISLLSPLNFTVIRHKLLLLKINGCERIHRRRRCELKSKPAAARQFKLSVKRKTVYNPGLRMDIQCLLYLVYRLLL